MTRPGRCQSRRRPAQPGAPSAVTTRSLDRWACIARAGWLGAATGCLLLGLAACGGGGSSTAAEASGPAIASFSADQPELQEGQATWLRARFSGGTGQVLPGPVPVLSGQALSVAPGDDTRYTLVVTGPDGRQSSRSLDLRIVLDLSWAFDEAAGWSFTAEPPSLASAALSEGALVLQAAMAFTDTGVRCGQVTARNSFGDTRLREGRYAQLSLSMDVLAWDLGLGRFDTNIPVLSLDYAGEQVQFPVSGFLRLPAVARVDWGHPARLSIDGVTVATAQPQALADGRGPALSLSANGCSEGMSQRLVVDRISVSAR